MTHWTEQGARVKILALAAAVVPAGVFIAILRGPILDLASQRQARAAELSAWRENTYRPDWFDSTTAILRTEVESLRAFQVRVRRILVPESAFSADPLRQEAQALGCEVLRLSPSRDTSGGMQRLRLRWEMRADFASALRFLRTLRLRHPEAFLEEALLRRGGNSAGKLEMNLTMLVHLEPGGRR